MSKYIEQTNKNLGMVSISRGRASTTGSTASPYCLNRNCLKTY